MIAKVIRSYPVDLTWHLHDLDMRRPRDAACLEIPNSHFHCSSLEWVRVVFCISKPSSQSSETFGINSNSSASSRSKEVFKLDVVQETRCVLDSAVHNLVFFPSLLGGWCRCWVVGFGVGVGVGVCVVFGSCQSRHYVNPLSSGSQMNAYSFLHQEFT